MGFSLFVEVHVSAWRFDNTQSLSLRQEVAPKTCLQLAQARIAVQIEQFNDLHEAWR